MKEYVNEFMSNYKFKWIMKISELIEEFESCLKEEGDLNVVIKDYADGNNYPVNNLKVYNSTEFGCKICLIEWKFT